MRPFHLRSRRSAALLAGLALSLTASACGVTSTHDLSLSSASYPTGTQARAAAGTDGASYVDSARKKKHKKKKHKKRKKFRKHVVRSRASDPTPARPSVATNPTNPLAGRPWGVYEGPMEGAWAPYVNATGTNKALLAKIALRPKAAWFGAWIPNNQIASKVSAYIANSQAGNPQALVQMAIFRMVPWEHAACTRLPTAAEQASYKQWIDQFASAVGSAHTAIIMQPDGPFALCAPGGSKLPSSLIAYATRTLSALPNTSVYIDAGAADWPAPGSQGGVTKAVQILTQAGVQYARGFAMNSTHYSDVNLEVRRGALIAQALAARGYGSKHFVVSTSSNGHPFVFGKYTGSDDNNAFVCPSRTAPASMTCVTLGIPPTSDVTNSRWRLWSATIPLARSYVDGFMWFGRPWLYRQATPFQLDRALQLARSTPF